MNGPSVSRATPKASRASSTDCKSESDSTSADGPGDSFSAGNDLAEFAAINAGDRERVTGNSLVSALARSTVPIVAAVQGRAVGVGATMLLHCDLVYATADARLSVPFVNLALVPEAASSLLLPARIGHARVRDVRSG